MNFTITIYNCDYWICPIYFPDPPIGNGGDRHEGQIHPPQAEEGPQLQADGRRRVNGTTTTTAATTTSTTNRWFISTTTTTTATVFEGVQLWLIRRLVQDNKKVKNNHDYDNDVTKYITAMTSQNCFHSEQEKSTNNKQDPMAKRNNESSFFSLSIKISSQWQSTHWETLKSFFLNFKSLKFRKNMKGVIMINLSHTKFRIKTFF